MTCYKCVTRAAISGQCGSNNRRPVGIEQGGQTATLNELNHVSDQVIRETPASRGTETSAEVLVGPPWRMVSNAGQQQWYGVIRVLQTAAQWVTPPGQPSPPPIRLFSRRRKASGERV